MDVWGCFANKEALTRLRLLLNDDGGNKERGSTNIHTPHPPRLNPIVSQVNQYMYRRRPSPLLPAPMLLLRLPLALPHFNVGSTTTGECEERGMISTTATTTNRTLIFDIGVRVHSTEGCTLYSTEQDGINWITSPLYTHRTMLAINVITLVCGATHVLLVRPPPAPSCQKSVCEGELKNVAVFFSCMHSFNPICYVAAAVVLVVLM